MMQPICSSVVAAVVLAVFARAQEGQRPQPLPHPAVEPASRVAPKPEAQRGPVRGERSESGERAGAQGREVVPQASGSPAPVESPPRSDGEGKVVVMSPEERAKRYLDSHPEVRATLFAAADADGDGTLSEEENETMRELVRARLKVVKAEIDAEMQKRAERRAPQIEIKDDGKLGPRDSATKPGAKVGAKPGVKPRVAAPREKSPGR